MSSSEKLRKRLKLLLRSRSRRRSWTSRPDEPQPKRAMLSNLQDLRNSPRFPNKTWEKSVGTEQPECPTPCRQCQWHHEKKRSTMDYYKNCRSTRKQSQNTMQVLGMSVMYLFIWLGCTRETRSSHSYSASTAVHPALAAIAARAGFRGTALVLVQEPVLPTWQKGRKWNTRKDTPTANTSHRKSQSSLSQSLSLSRRPWLNPDLDHSRSLYKTLSS